MVPGKNTHALISYSSQQLYWHKKNPRPKKILKTHTLLRRRFVVNIPKLLWAARRQTLLLVALLCNDRASLGAETDGAVPDGAAHAVVWLAQLAKRQQCEEEPLKVGVVMVVR